MSEVIIKISEEHHFKKMFNNLNDVEIIKKAKEIAGLINEGIYSSKNMSRVIEDIIIKEK